MIDAGLTSLGIVNMQMVSQDEYRRENNRILEELFVSTKRQLEDRRSVCERALAIIVQEETLSGDRFRELLEQLAA